MVSLRRSGGSVAFFWHGKLPDPRDAAFAEALGKRRFRSIEDAASEEVSIGWVTPKDPTGRHFAPEDLQAGTAAWLRLRIDTKVLPRKWLAIHRDAAARAKGRRLSARENRELRDDLASKLLPRVLPTVQLIDALLFFGRRTALLLHSRRAAGEAFGKLFFETFALPLVRAEALTLAQRSGIDRDMQQRLDRVEPVRWPRRQSAPETNGNMTHEREGNA
jgi:DNA recombination-dependent growth factor C